MIRRVPWPAMATGRETVEREPRAALVHLPRPEERDRRRSTSFRRRRMGSLRTHAEPGPEDLCASVQTLVPGRVGRPGEDPHLRRCAPGGQPRRRHPFRCPNDHARHRGGTRPTGLRPGRLLLPRSALGGDDVGPRRWRSRPSRQRRPDPPRPGRAGSRLPRRDQGTIEDLHRPLPPPALRSRRLHRDRHAGRRPRHPHRRGRGRGVDADRLPPPQAGQAPRCPLLSRDGQHAGLRARSASVSTSQPSSSSGSSIP